MWPIFLVGWRRSPSKAGPLTGFAGFFRETTIKYQISSDRHVTLRIYNLLGEEIRTLVYEAQRAGEYQMTWDGKDRFGCNVASGIYLAHIQTGQAAQVKKMTLLK